MEEKKMKLDTENTLSENDKKAFDADEIVKSIFNNQPGKAEDADGKVNDENKKQVKKPVNIFSRPINVMQTPEARKSRLTTVILEGLLFGAFLTAITAIYSISGLDLSLTPETPKQTPSVFFFVLEFIVFSVLVGVGDWFLTEKRVNNYNQSVAGLSFDIHDEIATALKEQEADGISKDDAAAQNSANGEEKPFIEIKPSDKNDEKSLTDKAFDAFIGVEKAGSIESCKGIILNSSGIEPLIVKISDLSSTDKTYANGVAMELIGAVRDVAMNEGIAAVAIPASVYGDLNLTLPSTEKFGIKTSEETKIVEAYPGALMGISGELK